MRSFSLLALVVVLGCVFYFSSRTLPKTIFATSPTTGTQKLQTEVYRERLKQKTDDLQKGYDKMDQEVGSQ
ncbi:MAG: hypothetical protein H7Y37_06140 [Anaerolineae bacterium]|nr:hypothetical protein [Gloeobacterales cyanobacterium ES-bin-313]